MCVCVKSYLDIDFLRYKIRARAFFLPLLYITVALTENCYKLNCFNDSVFNCSVVSHSNAF